MGKTPVYGLPYEGQNDQPGSSIRVEAPGVLLAEAVETELQRVDADIQTIQDDLAALQPGTLVAYLKRNLTAQTLATGVEVPVSFDEVALDRLGAFNAGQPTRYTPNVAGWYNLEGMVGYESSSAGTRRARWWFNGAVIDGGFLQNHADLHGFTTQFLAPSIPVAFDGIADYIELIARQSSGGNLNTGTGSTCPWVKLTYAGPL